MRKITLLFIFFVCFFYEANFAAQVLIKNNKSFPPGEIIIIENGTVVVETEFGVLKPKFSQIEAILFDEKADSQKPGVQFQNGDVVSGEIISLKNGIINIQMQYGNYVVKNLGSVKSANFIKNTDRIDYSLEANLNSLFSLNQYEQIFGELLALENGVLIIKTRYGHLEIKESELEQIQFSRKKRKNTLNKQVIYFRNKDKVHGKIKSFKNGTYHINTNFGEMLINEPNSIVNVVYEKNSKIKSVIMKSLSELPREYRFIKLSIERGYSQGVIQIAEIEFYDTDNEKIKVTINDYQTKYDSTWSIKKMLDGNLKTQWESGNSFNSIWPKWVIFKNVKEGEGINIETIRIHTYKIKDFTLSGSEEGKQYEVILKGSISNSTPAKWESFSR